MGERINTSVVTRAVNNRISAGENCALAMAIVEMIMIITWKKNRIFPSRNASLSTGEANWVLIANANPMVAGRIPRMMALISGSP